MCLWAEGSEVEFKSITYMMWSWNIKLKIGSNMVHSTAEHTLHAM